MSHKIVKQAPKKSAELSDYMKGKIVGAYDFGISMAKIAREYDLPYTTVTTTIERMKKTGTATCKSREGRPTLLNDRDLRVLGNIVRNNPSATLDMITAAIQESSGVPIKRDAVRNNLKKLGLRSCSAPNKSSSRKGASKTD